MSNQPFKITVNNREYNVTPDHSQLLPIYKFETGCDYMFTLIQVEGEWQIKEADVKPFDEELIYDIGQQIEENQ